MIKQIIGRRAERLAAHYLRQQGLLHIRRNFRCHCGEIDLIMQDKEEIVFVEVRARSNSTYGGAIESITRHKKRCLIRTAHYYLIQHKPKSTCACRFDAVLINNHLPKHLQAEHIVWIKGAFEADF